MTARERQRRRRRRRSDPGRLVLILGGALVGMLLLVVAVAAGYVASIAADTPALSKLKPRSPGQTSTIYAADGSVLGVIRSDVVRTPIASAAIPPILKQATVAIEDRRFYEHGAVDYQAIIRAALRDLSSGQTLQGASTITMQLVKNLYIGSTRSFRAKVQEAVLAERLQRAHSRDWILTDYLNSVFYGTYRGVNAYGVEAAARLFFDRDASRLDLAQAALLAGLPQAPTSYNPFTAPRLATARRNTVLAKMAAQGYISYASAAAAERAPLELHHGNYYSTQHDAYFISFVEQQLIERYGEQTVLQGGLRVYTTLVPRLQALAQRSIDTVLNQPNDPAAAVVTENPANGEVEAMAQSGRYENSQFNLASQGLRQPGSTFKAIDLALALSRGIDPYTTYYLSHTLQAGWLPGYPTYTVHTDSGVSLNADLNLDEAIVQSDNTVFAQLAADLGERNVTAMAHALGVTSHLDSYPAEAIGGLTRGVTPLEMANVYASIADGGWRNKQISIRRVLFPSGTVDGSWGRRARVKVLSSADAAVETSILQDNVLRGTATQSAISCPSAAKTGTTSGLVDAWLDGYTPGYATIVWMGYPNRNISMTDVHGQPQYGGLLPAQIWHDYMAAVVTAPCAAFPTSAAPTYVPFSGVFERAGQAAYIPPAPPKGATGASGRRGRGAAPGAAAGQSGGASAPAR